ncbi:DUF839 domain-containing protein [Brachybacterium sp. ACRRE]|nr:DUF839 domain-containing protein [Brachybacterium sp. ACRRE]
MVIQLPLLMKDHVAGKRSPVTCALKCANACLGETCNSSSNSYFRDVASAALSRRAMLGGTAAGALAIAVAGTAGAPSADAAPVGPLVDAGKGPKAPNGSPLRFDAIDPVDYTVDEFTVPEGFEWHPIIKWGDKLFSDAPDFDWGAQTGEAQKRQFGYNNDYTEIQEIPDSDGLRAVMFVNHEYTNENIMLPEDTDAETVAEVGLNAHGLTVVELQREDHDSPYEYVVDADLNRRFLADTKYAFTGPARFSDLLKTKDFPRGNATHGTFGNCSGGLTPWGTQLSGEENFNGYFRTAGDTDEDKRYGMSAKATARGWENVDPRFDTTNEGYENSAHHFGWIVEVDPWDPESTPRKHTAMGRFKHEGANVIIAEDGHAVAYMGDDEKFDYLYKFVSAKKYKEGNRKHNMTLLEEGDLYVAKFEGNSGTINGSGAVPKDGAFDGTGRWIPLIVDGKSQVEGMDVDEVLVKTRLAADKVGPTKMDRCEDVEPSLKSRKVYVACTNNDGRGTEGKAGPDEVNPRTVNRDGHVVEIDELGKQSGTSFAWNLLLVCGDPAQNTSTYFSGFPKKKVSPISCPDNLAFDSVGNLWISTDGAPSTIGYNDGLFRVTLEGNQRGKVEQFASVPVDAETCGPIVRDQDRTAFVSVQHPGEDGTFDEQVSYWPEFEGTGPKPTVVQILPARTEFSDVKKGSEHYDAIQWAALKGIIPGRADDTFAPRKKVTRAALAAFLYRAAGKPEVSLPRNEPFGDVEQGETNNYRAIIWAKQQGIVGGYSDGTFRPTQAVTRQETAAYLYRYAGSPSAPKPTKAPFSDVPASSTFARQIAWLKKEGVATGSTFQPAEALTREWAAEFLHGLIAEKKVAFKG